MTAWSNWLRDRASRLATDTAAPEGEVEWFEGGDGHGYRYQYIGPIHYYCECGAYFLNRDRWLTHKAESAAPVAVEGVETVAPEGHPASPSCSLRSCGQLPAAPVAVEGVCGVLRAITPVEPEGDTSPTNPDAHYCRTCGHPHGYHTPDRGCTMPLDRNGLPVMRTDATIGPCGCQRAAEVERDALILAIFEPDDDCAHNMLPLYVAVERILAARIEQARAGETALRERIEALRATMPHALDCGIPCNCWKRWLHDALTTDAYQAGAYAEAYQEGKVWKRKPTDPDPEPHETEDEVVNRLLNDSDPT